MLVYGISEQEDRKIRNKQLLRNTWDRHMEFPFWLAMVCGVVVAFPVVVFFTALLFPFVAGEYLWKRERE